MHVAAQCKALWLPGHVVVSGHLTKSALRFTSMKPVLQQQHNCRDSTAIWAAANLNHVRAECQA